MIDSRTTGWICFILFNNPIIRTSMTSVTDETTIRKSYRDSADLLLSYTLSKITRPVTLEEVHARISTHLHYSAGDSTSLIRTFRNRKYGGI